MKSQNKNIGSQLFFTILLSSLFGIAGEYYFGCFFVWFLTSLFFQFVVFYIIITYFQIFYKLKNKKIENDMVIEMLKHTTELTCENCKEPNSVALNYSIPRNEFICKKCLTKNLVMIDLKTVIAAEN